MQQWPYFPDLKVLNTYLDDLLRHYRRSHKQKHCSTDHRQHSGHYKHDGYYAFIHSHGLQNTTTFPEVWSDGGSKVQSWAVMDQKRLQSGGEGCLYPACPPQGEGRAAGTHPPILHPQINVNS